MANVVLVGFGGFIGAALRFLLSEFVGTSFASPIPTMLVNIIGCFVIGMLDGLALGRAFPNQQTRLFAMTGVVGGFTTFSAFSLETVHLVDRQQSLFALFNIVGTVILCIAAVILGRRFGLLLFK